jgi:hypothetical protein
MDKMFNGIKINHTAYQDSLFEQIQNQLSILGLCDMNFVFKKLELTKYFQPSKCQTNQAIIRLEKIPMLAISII